MQAPFSAFHFNCSPFTRRLVFIRYRSFVLYSQMHIYRRLELGRFYSHKIPCCWKLLLFPASSVHWSCNGISLHLWRASALPYCSSRWVRGWLLSRCYGPWSLPMVTSCYFEFDYVWFWLWRIWVCSASDCWSWMSCKSFESFPSFVNEYFLDVSWLAWLGLRILIQRKPKSSLETRCSWQTLCLKRAILGRSFTKILRSYMISPSMMPHLGQAKSTFTFTTLGFSRKMSFTFRFLIKKKFNFLKFLKFWLLVDLVCNLLWCCSRIAWMEILRSYLIQTHWVKMELWH